ncbi:MAG TPA: site-specific integrase [Solirubrobacteraceae bacterium]
MAERIREKVKGAKYVYRVHSRACAMGEARTCNCRPTYQASVYSARECKLIRKHFAGSGDVSGQREAELWRGEMDAAVEQGKIKAPTRTTVAEAGRSLLAGMRDGTIKNRSGLLYKPSTVRRYELALDKHLGPLIGHVALCKLDRARIKAVVAAWEREGMAASSVRNNLDPLRVLIREAIEDECLAVDPMAGAHFVPKGGGRRERVANRAEARELIEALPQSEQALWACAFYGGLRRGELRALRWADVDFDGGVVKVERGWDDRHGEQEPKSDAGKRAVPLAGVLRRAMVAHKLSSGRAEADLVFGRTPAEPFVASTVRARALKAWARENKRRLADAEVPESVELLHPITLHEARHSAASYLIEAGLNDLELTAMIGHSDSRTTKNIYGHLFSDSAATVAAKLDAYHGVASSG